MKRVRYALVTDGAFDRVLLHPIDWLLSQQTDSDFDGEWVDPCMLASKQRGLEHRIAHAITRLGCDLLFVHRDAETQTRLHRCSEISQALDRVVTTGIAFVPSVCIVPVRMTETWLLF